MRRDRVCCGAVKTRQTLVSLLLLGFLLAGCAGTDPSVVPYTWRPATPIAPTGATQSEVATSLVVAEPERPYSVGDEVVLVLTWTNEGSSNFQGSLQDRVLAPAGFHLKKSGGCTKALANDLTCNFRGVLIPGAQSQRIATYSVRDEALVGKSTATFTLVGSGDEVTIALS